MNDRLSPREQRVLSDLIGTVGSLRKKVGNLERAQHARLTTIHAGDGTGLQVVDDHGKVVSRIGGKAALNGDPVQVVDGPDPIKPGAPVVESDEPGVVRVELSDTPPSDLRVCRVLASLDAATPGVPVGSIWPGEDTTVVSPSAGVWYVRIQWVTKSGKESELSDAVTVEVEPPVDAQDIQDTLEAAEEKLNTYRDEVAAPRFQALEEGLSKNSDNLQDARDRLTAAEEAFAPIPGRIEVAEQEVGEAKDAAEAAEARAVEANNRAMTRLANGNFNTGLDYWVPNEVTISDDAHSGSTAALFADGGTLRPESSMPVVAGQIWELSLYHKGTTGTLGVSVWSQDENGGYLETFENFTLQPENAWQDSGALRFTIPDGAYFLQFTVYANGTGWLVDDIVLRDVTDVVRLEEAANANRREVERLQGEYEVLQLAVDGEGGLRDRLDTAEDDLENIDTELDQVATNLETALTGPVDHDRLRVGEGAFDTGFIGELWAGNIRALAAELASLIVASPNMIPNGDLTQGDQFWTLSNAEIVTDGTPPGYEYAIRRYPGAGTVSHDVTFPVQGGHEYLFEMWIKADKPNSSFYWDMRDQNGTMVGAGDVANWSIALEPEGHSPGTRPVSDLTVPTDWTRVRTVLRPGAHVTELYLASTYFNHSNGTERDATVSIGGVRMTPRRGAEVLVDGSVTAEKIHATREMITKIMGAEWAYIAEQLVVEGEIITNHINAITGALKKLSVTERADLFEAFITTLGAQEATIEMLVGEEAWITSAMIDELTAEKVTVTENFVGRVAELLHLVVDRIDVNSLWADQSWQASGHFGSEDADQRTEVDGSGVTLYRKIDGEFIPAAQFGGGEVRLAFFDENEEAVGAITQDGHASGALANYNQYQWQGRPLFGTAIPEGNEPVTDVLSQRFIARNERVLNGATDGAGQSEYGFLPLSFQAVAGMTYEIIVPGLQMWNIDQAVVNAEIHYTMDGRPAVLSDPILGKSQWAVTTHTGTQKVVPHFTRFFHCEDGCEVNLLLCVRASNPVPRWWHTASNASSTAELWVRPVGITPPITGGTRDVYLGHPDLGGGEKSYFTGWTPTWHQAYYRAGQHQYQGNSNKMLFGLDRNTGEVYITHFGGYRNSSAYSGNDDAGKTMAQALAGAFITDGTLTLTGAPSTNNSGHVWIQWHGLNSAPTTFSTSQLNGLLQSVHVSSGQQSVIDLPRVVLDAIQAGTFEGFTLYHSTYEGQYIAVHSQDSITSRLRQPMMRLRYVK